MKTELTLALLLIGFMQINAQKTDSVRVVGHGSMADLPATLRQPGEGAIRYAFAGYKQDTKLEIILWKYNPDTQQVESSAIINNVLNAKENPKILVTIGDEKGIPQILLSHLGEFTSVHPVKSEEAKTLQPDLFTCRPNVYSKIIPMVLFSTGADNAVKQNILQKQELAGKEDIIAICKKLAGGATIQLLTYQLTAQQ